MKYLEECINFRISFAGEICNFISLCCAPSQSHGFFGTFADNLELNLGTIGNKNHYLIVILGDFNDKSSNWYKHDKTTYEGSKIDPITSQFGLQQLTQENHTLSNSSSCTDLIFMSQPNLVMESRVHSSLHGHCYHQLAYVKFNLKMWYPPPYKGEVWHYHHANVDQIKRATEQFPWEKLFRNLHINEKVYLFNKTIKNILPNYITHETVTCDDKDPP